MSLKICHNTTIHFYLSHYYLSYANVIQNTVYYRTTMNISVSESNEKSNNSVDDSIYDGSSTSGRESCMLSN